MTFDILVKDGTIIDGTGKPRFQGDIGISDERIKAIGTPNLAGAVGRKTISAFGRFVAPGFIDITSHADKNWALFSNPQQDYLLTQGVTSILVGNCGTSLAPLPARQAVESFKKWLLVPGITVNWLAVGEFLAELAKRPLGVNVGTLIGHGTVRRGLTRGESRPLTEEELPQFSQVIERGIREGAFGLSTGLVYSHEAPASPEELSELAKAIAAADGVYKTHLRHEGFNLAPAVNETVEIVRTSKARVVISHLKAIGKQAWPVFGKAIAMIERASDDGLAFYFDIFPYQRTGSFLYLLLPPWARAGGFAEILKRLRDPATRATIVTELQRLTIHYDRYIVATSATPSTNGKTIQEIAARTGETPEDTILELLLANDCRVTIFGKAISGKNLATGISHPLGMIASNGSGISAELRRTEKLVHPRSSGAATHFLHRFIRERGLVSWEEGIRKLTSFPAGVIGFRDRGRIQEKSYADLVIFDPEEVHDGSTYRNPFVHSTGIHHVIVNGKLAIENGQLTGIAAGQVLKKS